MRLRRTISLITSAGVLIAMLTASPQAWSSDSICIDRFAELAQDSDRTFLNASDIEQIQQILSRTDLSSEETARKAFDVYAQSRIKDLPAELRKNLEDTYRNRTTFKSSKSEGSHYDPKKDRIQITRLKTNDSSAFMLTSLAHEFEHAVIEQTYRLETGKASPLDKKDLKGSIVRFNHELAAMRAEWNMAQAIPLESRQALLEQIKIDNDIPKQTRDYLIRSLGNSNLEREEYIAKEHAAKRYSLESIKTSHRIDRITDGLLSFSGYTMTALGAATWYCGHKVNQPDFDTQAKWFQKICIPNPLVRASLPGDKK